MTTRSLVRHLETMRTASDIRLASIRERCNGFYALKLYHPVAALARGRRGAVCREVGARRAVQVGAICGAPHHAALRRFGDVRLVGARAQGGCRLRRRLARL